ncbi:endolytic transglycosylase MltG [Rickettsiales bacterium]|nr:endolytic transglycosylase MltG [Rickettsiales bacterium]MDB2550487.1 endolytic transglycosylase MltG [Rickettsiales bacterium]
MLRKVFKVASAISTLTILFVITIFFVILFFRSPNKQHIEDKNFVIESGLTLKQVINNLHKENIIQHPTLFLYLSQLFKGYDPKVKYGEYNFEKNISYYDILHKMHKGYVFFRRFTIAEGLSSNSALKIIDSTNGLVGDVPEFIEEGSLLPETYYYSRNDKKSNAIKRMKRAMTKTIDELWASRDKNNKIIKSKKDAIILASIVERETSLEEERKTVASVFLNRLRIGMKLQSDPTIIYSFTFGDTSLERKITYKDINNGSEFNTYNIYGLPPAPISNPGRASIEAVLNPIKTDYLYFVATGYGGHNFSTNLKDHNKFVKEYYDILKKTKSQNK